MIATTKSTSAHADLEQYLKVSQVAAEFGIHQMTVRRATSSGALQCARSAGGQRLIQRRWVHEWLGIPMEQQDTAKAVLCVCRVSSRGQMTSLEEQEKLTTSFARENYPNHKIIVKKRIQSGIILDSDEVLEILDLILNQEIEALIVNWEDRLTRTGFSLFTALLKRNNIKIHILQTEPDKSLEEQLSMEILQFLTHYTNKVSGLKVRKLYGVEIEQDHLKDIFLDWRRGMSLSDLEAKYAHLRNSKGQAYSFTVIHKRLRQNLNALEIAYGREVTSELDDFLKEHVRYCDDKKHLTFKEIYGAYGKYCDGKGLKALSKPKFSDQLSRLGILERRFINTYGQTAFRGMELK